VDQLPLAGFTVAVTAARRREELTALLQRRGARTVEAPAIRIVPTSDDAQLQAATRLCVEQPPDVVLATTGIGFRGWMEAADGWGVGEALLERIAKAELLVRGPKAKGAVRAAGLVEAWSPDSEATDEVLRRLLDEGVAGRRIAVQLHGEPLPDFCDGLREAGAEVVEIPVYRWVPADDLRPLRRLVGQIAAGHRLRDLHQRTGGRLVAPGGRRGGPAGADAGGSPRPGAGGLRRAGDSRPARAPRGCPQCSRPAPASARWCAPSSSTCRRTGRAPSSPGTTSSRSAGTTRSSTAVPSS